MNVVIEVHFISNENKVMQRGSFPLKGRKPEKVAFDFWQQVIDGEDKTEIIKEME